MHLEVMLSKYPNTAKKYGHQGRTNDQLFEPCYGHVRGNTGAQCDSKRLLFRPESKDDQLQIYYGNIASGSAIIKNGQTRDRITKQ